MTTSARFACEIAAGHCEHAMRILARVPEPVRRDAVTRIDTATGAIMAGRVVGAEALDVTTHDAIRALLAVVGTTLPEPKRDALACAIGHMLGAVYLVAMQGPRTRV